MAVGQRAITDYDEANHHDNEITNILDTFLPEEVRLDTPSAYRILAHVFMHALRDREARPAC